MKIAFTSCIRVESFAQQQEWEYIYNADPDYLFLLGDNIYMDFGINPFRKDRNCIPAQYSPGEFEEIMWDKYNKQFQVPAFKRLVEKMRSKNGYYAIWDDHDFAWNNARGKEVSTEVKNISRKLFHEFHNCSTNLPEAYYYIDTPLARIFFLDNRYHSDQPGNNATLLGEQQWQWLESNLNHSAQYTIICAGLTLNCMFDNWEKYPKDLSRLSKLLEPIPQVLFLGGDIHMNRFKKPTYYRKLNCVTPPQFISSGMQIHMLDSNTFIDERHNWALLELQPQEAKITYYQNNRIEKIPTWRANRWLKNSFS